MAKDFVRRYVTKDGNTRINIYKEECPCDPRSNTDFPLHCEDWHRDYSIMNTDERANCNRSSGARSLLGWFIREYGDEKKVLKVLFENGKHLHDRKASGSDALVYDKSDKDWIHMSYGNHYNYQTKENEVSWYRYQSLCCRKDEIEIYDVVDSLEDDTIEYLIEHCMTDKIKIASYSFGYYGEISFSDGVDCKADGIAWLEKDEIIKYCNHTEEFWRENKFTDIDWVHTEIEAWADNEVYGFVVENRIEYKLHKEYTNIKREAEDSVEEEWEETDSCWGYYGELDDEHIGYILEGAGFKKEELDEEA